MEGIFQQFWDKNILKVFVIIKIQKCYNIYTYKAFKETNCRKVSPELLRTICNFEDLKYIPKTPTNLENLFQCPIILETGYIPDVMETVSEGEMKILFMESFILKHFTLKINSTLEVIPYEFNHTIDDEDRSADIFMGSYNLKLSRTKNYSFSYPYEYQNFVMILKKVKMPIPTLDFMKKPFKLKPLLFLIVTLIFYLIIFRISEKKSLVDQMFLLYTLSLGISYHKFHLLNKTTKKFVFWYLILQIILTSIFTGFMFKSLRIIQFKKLPKSIKELYESNYSETIVYDWPIYFEQLILLPDFKILSKKLAIKQVPVVQIEVEKSLKPIIGIGTSSYFDSKIFYILPERFFRNCICLYLSKNSIFLAVLNRVIFELFESGILLNILKKDETRENIIPKRPITIIELLQIFKVIFIMYSLSFLVFCFEVALKCLINAFIRNKKFIIKLPLPSSLKQYFLNFIK